MTPASKPVSLVADIYARLRASLLLGEIAPGERLRLNDLAQAHGVSLSVVREAVTRLASEQLVEASPQRGFRVRELSVDDLDDLTWTRIHIETLALRESIAHGPLSWESNLMAAHHTLARTPIVVDGGPNPEWMAHHNAFHAALVAGCARPRLLYVRQQLYDASELYRYWLAGAHRVAPYDVAADHERLLEATLARDAELASARLTEHLRTTSDLLRASAAERAA